MSHHKISKILKKSARVTLTNIKENPFSLKRPPNRQGQHAQGQASKGYSNIKPRIGYEEKTPFVKLIPKYGYNRDSHLQREYLPLTLWQLQRMIDLGRIDPSEPIDLTTLVNSRALYRNINSKHYGVFLVEQGADIFKAKVNIEVQISNEMSVAAVERNGGTITTAFFDLKSVYALTRPVEYFLQGNPVHKRLLPPQELVTYYTDPNTRGYLSDPAQLQLARVELAQKYGYQLPDLTKDECYEMLMMRKDPRQVFFGISPGWLINLQDKTVIKPEAEYIKNYLRL